MSTKLIIAGGGIGGMAAALALHRAGMEVTLFERAPVFTEVGSGLSVWPNATRVLQSLGVLDRVLARGAPVAQFNLYRPDGSVISTIKMDRFDTPALSVHRADLHRALYEPLPVACLEPGQVIQSFVQNEEGVTVHLASGREVRADGLIGADGLNSVVRAQIHGAVPPVYRGYCIWRGIAADPGGIIAGHIGETWGSGLRFGILAMGQGRVCWYATRNDRVPRADGPDGRKAEVQELFRNWHQPIPALIEGTLPADILKNDACDRPPLRLWGQGCVTLLGDAAHPITPNMGQGACMAIEDAACLVKALHGSADVAGAFRAYEAMRHARTARIALQSRRIGMIGQWKNPGMVWVRNFITRLVLARSGMARLNAVYSYKI